VAQLLAFQPGGPALDPQGPDYPQRCSEQRDLAGVASALIAAAAAWSGAKQYATLARAYTYAGMELRIVDRLMLETDEAMWAAEVVDVEDAVSRQHTMLRASHTRAIP
jgi:hypothetical protein